MNVYEGCSWYLASIAVARESGEGNFFTPLGWQVNFIYSFPLARSQPAQVLNRFCPQTVKNKIITLCYVLES